MKTTGNTILITGGATGIGFALAETLIREGNSVIVCGRREEKLAEAKRKLPSLKTRRCDLSTAEERRRLFAWASASFPELNILVNNAGIQRMIDLTRGAEELESGEDEIEVNLKATIHLSALFTPFLVRRESAIVNVSSGLGFVPIARMPVYCATKAAIHSFSLSLRHQLRGTSVKVFELIPPTVDTELDKGARARRGQVDRGIPAAEVAAAALTALQADVYECAVGRAAGLAFGTREERDQAFQGMNARG
jgi:uncharacterized oxidoreductase